MQVVRKKVNNILKIINKDCQINPEVNIESYLTEERIEIGNMGEIDAEIC